ncbi:hypothetical protein [Desulforamulus reducens]|nr:hypothetical protein [Desulforamulus reducens]
MPNCEYSDIRFNYCALALCILTQYSVEGAIRYLSEGTVKLAESKNEITEEDLLNMVRMKDTMTYQQIGEIYGLTNKAVYHLIKSFQMRVPKFV